MKVTIEQLINETTINALELETQEAIDIFLIFKRELLLTISIHERIKSSRKRRHIITNTEKRKLKEKYEKYKVKLIKLKSKGVSQKQLKIFTKEWKQIRERYIKLMGKYAK